MRANQITSPNLQQNQLFLIFLSFSPHFYPFVFSRYKFFLLVFILSYLQAIFLLHVDTQFLFENKKNSVSFQYVIPIVFLLCSVSMTTNMPSPGLCCFFVGVFLFVRCGEGLVGWAFFKEANLTSLATEALLEQRTTNGYF